MNYIIYNNYIIVAVFIWYGHIIPHKINSNLFIL